MMTTHPLLILTGPSCAGKTPLVRALRHLHPDWSSRLQCLILYNSRPPRPGEHDGIDYRFRRRYELEMMQLDKDCICMDVREDFQVLNVRELVHLLERGPVLFEGNPFIARILQTDQRLLDVEHRSIFLSPFSKEELIEIDATEDAPPVKDVVAEIMRQKLVRRTQRQKGQLEESDLESIYLRSKSTWQELTMAPLFDHVVVNHDGEDSDNWTNAPVLTGEARLATEAVFAGFCGIPDRRLEHWAGGVLSRQGTQLAEHV